jgi:hypothetical protein
MATLTNEVTKSQCAKILAYMQRGLPITPDQAKKKYKCARLAARINDLRKKGHSIQTTMIYYGRVKYASYSLIKAQ